MRPGRTCIVLAFLVAAVACVPSARAAKKPAAPVPSASRFT
jgi:hypothetical protein